MANKADNIRFTCTEDAIAYGKKATDRDVVALLTRRIWLLDQCSQEMANDNLQAAMDLAVEAQLCREALEARGLSHDSPTIQILAKPVLS